MSRAGEGMSEHWSSPALPGQLLGCWDSTYSVRTSSPSSSRPPDISTPTPCTSPRSTPTPTPWQCTFMGVTTGTTHSFRFRPAAAAEGSTAAPTSGMSLLGHGAGVVLFPSSSLNLRAAGMAPCCCVQDGILEGRGSTVASAGPVSAVLQSNARQSLYAKHHREY